MIKDVQIPDEPIEEVILRTKLSDQINQMEYWCRIGEDTPINKHRGINKLAETFQNLWIKMPTHLHESGIEFVEDLGLSYRRYNDASGGEFGTGLYRLLLIKHSNRKSCIYGLSIQTTGKTLNNPKYGNSTGKSVLIVSVKGMQTDRILVQISLNEFLEVERIIVRHNGKFGFKKANSQKFISKVEKTDPDLVDNGKI